MNEKGIRSIFRIAVVIFVGIALAVGVFVRMQGAGAESLAEAQKNLAAAQAELKAAQDALGALESEKGTLDSVIVQASGKFSKDFTLNGAKYYVPVNGSTAGPNTNSTMIAVQGQYVNSDSKYNMQSILAYINSVRKEAYDLGYVKSYVPLQFDDRLTRYAQMRAVEASIFGDHVRPSKTNWYDLDAEGFCSSYAENLSWGSSFYGNVELWVNEKTQYELARQGKKAGQYGHYTTLINPMWKYIGIGQFNCPRTINKYGTAMAAEFAATKPASGTADVKVANEVIYQLVWAYSPAISSSGSDGSVKFDPKAVPGGDPVFTTIAQGGIFDAKKYVTAQATTLLSNYKNLITSKEQAVKLAQEKVDAAQERVNALSGNAGNTGSDNTGSGGTGTGQTTTTTYSIKTAVTPTAGGTLAGAGTYEKGKKVTLTATPKTGYVFSKWSVSGSAYSSKINANGSATLTFTANANITITATFTQSTVTWTRLYGSKALDTMQKITTTGWTQTGGTVVIATMNSYHDTLSAAPLAGVTNSPILLTSMNSLSTQTKSELQRLKPKTIYIAGGEAAISKNVLVQIASAVPGATVKRLYGPTAIETAVALAKQAKNSWSDTAFLATSKTYHDALSGAPLAYNKKMPIFLTNGTTLSTTVIEGMRACGIKKVIILGGTSAINANVEAAVKKSGFTVTTRLAGPKAIQTSRYVAEYGIKSLGMSVNNMGVATQNSYYDALCGAPLCGLKGSVLVLVSNTNSENAIVAKTYKTASGMKNGYIFGGAAVVPSNIEQAFKDATK